MNFLQRILLLCALLFTCAVGAAFVWQLSEIRSVTSVTIRTIPDASPPPQTPLPFGDLLSRMSMIPWTYRKRELLAVMVENHEDARPHQKGLAEALLVFEWPVEGFIARFCAVFDRRELPSLMGPVRSLRPYFVDLLLPWKIPILHAGGSPEAFERIDEAIVPTVNGLHFSEKFVRDENIAPPHNLFIGGGDALVLTADFIPRPVEWPPYDTSESTQESSKATVITLNFLSPDHNVHWTFDPFFGTYKRENGGILSAAHPTNVLVLEIPVSEIGEFGRLHIPTTGGGRALLFRNGKVVQARWMRDSLTAWLSFQTESGDALLFAKGKTWITAMPTLDRVTWTTNMR